MPWLALVAVLVLGGCADGRPDAPVLSERAYLAWVKRDCLAGKRLVAQAASAPTAAAYLQRIADGAQTLQRDFAGARAPVGLRPVHQELVRLGDEQLALIRTARRSLAVGRSPQGAAELEARNRALVRRANRIADRLGLADCVSDLGAP